MLPHITNSEAGRNKYEPLYKNLFEIYFTIPQALQDQGFSKDVAILSEHVLSISGLNNLDKTAEAGVQQKFMGTTRTFVNSGVDDTSAELTVKFTLNLRGDNATDNYIYKLFKAWARLNYDISTGERALKKDYCADWMKVKVGNKAGNVYRSIVFKDIMLNGPISMEDSLDYGSTGDVMELEVKFKSDWWDDTDA